MAIGIIGAMDEEIAFLEEHIEHVKKVTIAGSSLIEGKLFNKDIILVKSGIGKVNAAMTATILMERYQPDFIINTGTAGGFSDQLEVGDLVISNEVVHHDVDVTGFNYAYGQVPGLPAVFKADPELIQTIKTIVDQLHINFRMGMIATGDSFMNDPDKISIVKKRFPQMIALEMEAASIAQVCYQYGVPFVIIRALSDIAGKDSAISFDQFISIASKNAANLIMNVIESL